MPDAYEMSGWRHKRRAELLAQGLSWSETIPIVVEEESKIIDDERLAEQANAERQRLRRSRSAPLPSFSR